MHSKQCHLLKIVGAVCNLQLHLSQKNIPKIASFTYDMFRLLGYNVPLINDMQLEGDTFINGCLKSNLVLCKVAI